MKYWNCVNVPTPSWARNLHAPNTDTVENNEVVEIPEGAQTSAPSEPTSVVVEEVTEQDTVETQSLFSPEYHNMLNSAFDRPVIAHADIAQNSDVSIESVPGTEGYSISVKVPDNPSGLIINENPVSIIEENRFVSSDEAEKVVAAVEEVQAPTEPEINAEALLNTLQTTFDPPPVYETLTGPAEVTEVKKDETPLYIHDENVGAKIAKAIEELRDQIVPDVKLKRFSKRFIRNIPQAVIKAHDDAAVKFEAPSILDPYINLIPFVAEDPYYAQCQLMDAIITNLLVEPEALKKVVDSIEEYKKYLGVDEYDDDEEEDVDCPPDEESEEETND